MDGTVLIADDDRTIRTVLTQAYIRAGCKVHATSSLKTLVRWVEERKGDLVITDVSMPDGDGIETIATLQAIDKSLPVIVISAQNTIATTIRANAAQAFDYLPKPFDLKELLRKSAVALTQYRHERPATPAPLPKQNPTDIGLVGKSAIMQALYKQIALTMNSGLPIAIRGESGTGRSLIAQTIHALSGRGGKLIEVGNDELSNFPPLIDALERARGATLLIENTHELSDSAQLNLIRVLDADVELPSVLITLPSGQSCPTGLRDALFYRTNTVTLQVPTLADRLDDFDDLIAHFAAEFAEFNHETLFKDATVARLKTLRWQGNVRELRNLVRLVALSNSVTGAAEQAIEDFCKAHPFVVDNAEIANTLSGAAFSHIQRYFDLHGQDLPAPGVYHRILREIEYPLIEIALDATNGNQAKCSDLLGINRNTLRKKISELDIVVTRRRKMM